MRQRNKPASGASEAGFMKQKREAGRRGVAPYVGSGATG